MKKKIFIAAAVIIGSTAQAQQVSQQTQDSIRELTEVTVTANKYPAKTLLTGKVVTVITRQQLEAAGGRDIAQVLTEQAGLYINGANSNPGKDKSVYLRGARVDHTLIMLDGVPLYDPSGIGSNFDIRFLAVDQVERIEILKGSQSTLYGTDAIAGVINIITRKAGIKPVSFSGSASYGSYRSFNGHASISGSRKQLDYAVQYTYHTTAGINEATDSSTVPHDTDRDGYDQHTFYASLGYKPAKHIRLQPYFRYTSLHTRYDQGAFTDELDLSNRSENVMVGVNNTFQLRKSILHLVYNFSRISRTYTDDSTQSRNGFATYSKGVYKGDEHFAEAYLVMPLSPVWKLTTGIDLRSSSSDQSYNSVSAYGPYKSELGHDSLKQDQLGVYAALSVNLKKGFNAEAGGRYTRHSAYGNNGVFNFNPSYVWKEQWKVFANLSSAFKSPTLYQLYSEYGNRKLDPEKALTVEAGLQYFTPDKKFNARVTGFNRRVKDAIVFYTDPVSYRSVYINQDRQDDQGLELESTLRLGERVSFKACYTYVDGKITTKQNTRDTRYFNLTRRPRSSFGLSTALQITRALYIGSGLTLTGKRTDIAYDAFYNPVTVKLKSYALWNIHGSYAFLKNRLSLFADLRNITNTQYTEVYGFNTTGFNGTAGVRFSL